MIEFRDVRCLCNRLLFRGEAKLLEIKCPNCKALWLIEGGKRLEVPATIR